MEHNINQERMREIEIFGIPALFSPNRVAPGDVLSRPPPLRAHVRAHVPEQSPAPHR